MVREQRILGFFCFGIWARPYSGRSHAVWRQLFFPIVLPQQEMLPNLTDVVHSLLSDVLVFCLSFGTLVLTSAEDRATQGCDPSAD